MAMKGTLLACGDYDWVTRFSVGDKLRTHRAVDVQQGPSPESLHLFELEAGRIVELLGPCLDRGGCLRLPIKPRGWLDAEALVAITDVASVSPETTSCERERMQDASGALWRTVHHAACDEEQCHATLGTELSSKESSRKPTQSPPKHGQIASASPHQHDVVLESRDSSQKPNQAGATPEYQQTAILQVAPAQQHPEHSQSNMAPDRWAPGMDQRSKDSSRKCAQSITLPQPTKLYQIAIGQIASARPQAQHGQDDRSSGPWTNGLESWPLWDSSHKPTQPETPSKSHQTAIDQMAAVRPHAQRGQVDMALDPCEASMEPSSKVSPTKPTQSAILPKLHQFANMQNAATPLHAQPGQVDMAPDPWELGMDPWSKDSSWKPIQPAALASAQKVATQSHVQCSQVDMAPDPWTLGLDPWSKDSSRKSTQVHDPWPSWSEVSSLTPAHAMLPTPSRSPTRAANDRWGQDSGRWEHDGDAALSTPSSVPTRATSEHWEHDKWQALYAPGNGK